MHEEALAKMLGSEWREHQKANGYFFSRCGSAVRARISKGALRVTMLKGTACGYGYRAISYPIGGGRYGRIYTHRAVCELFNGPAPDGGM